MKYFGIFLNKQGLWCWQHVYNDIQQWSWVLCSQTFVEKEIWILKCHGSVILAKLMSKALFCTWAKWVTNNLPCYWYGDVFVDLQLWLKTEIVNSVPDMVQNPEVLTVVSLWCYDQLVLSLIISLSRTSRGLSNICRITLIIHYLTLLYSLQYI